MLFCHDGVEIHYKKNEGGGKPILLLHGFGCSMQTVDCLFSYLSALRLPVVAVDLPGFGASGTPQEGWSIYDYAKSMRELLRWLDIERPVVIGHSFGGRIALILAAWGLTDGIVLIDSAGCKPRFSLVKWFKIKRYKRRKKQGKSVEGYGSSDYRSLSPAMQKTFVRVVNEHLDPLLPRILCPTLILWGKKDSETPPYMARRLKRKIKDSGIVFLEGGHYSFLDDPATCMAAIGSFVCSQ